MTNQLTEFLLIHLLVGLSLMVLAVIFIMRPLFKHKSYRAGIDLLTIEFSCWKPSWQITASLVRYGSFVRYWLLPAGLFMLGVLLWPLVVLFLWDYRFQQSKYRVKDWISWFSTPLVILVCMNFWAQRAELQASRRYVALLEKRVAQLKEYNALVMERQDRTADMLEQALWLDSTLIYLVQHP